MNNFIQLIMGLGALKEYQLKTKNMKKVTMSLDLAKKMYQGTNEEMKAFALENFPELGKVTNRIKTFEDACKELELQPSFVTSCEDTKDERAYKELKIIVQALNEGWKPNWGNSSEYKYYSYFNMSSSGSGFSYGAYGSVFTYSHVGSRLVFKSRELAEYAAKQFENIYKDFYTI